MGQGGIEERIQEFVTTNPEFAKTASQVFNEVASGGRLSLREAAKVSDIVFDQLAVHLELLAIEVERPSAQEVQRLFKASDADSSQTLDEREFQDFYAKVLMYAAKKAAESLGKSYGVGILAGIVGVMVAKRALRSIPLLGLLATPLLGLLPTALTGLALGATATYFLRKGGGVESFKARLFGQDP